MVDTPKTKKPTRTRQPRTKKTAPEEPAVAVEVLDPLTQEDLDGAIVPTAPASPVPEDTSRSDLIIPTGKEPLTEEEEQRKRELEAIVDSSFRQGFRALAEINEEKLYRVDFDNFEDYVKSTFSFSARKAYYLLDQVRVVEVLEEKLTTKDSEQIVHNNIPLPEKESQCRPLKDLTPEQVVEAWLKAVEIARKEGRQQPTAREVEQAVNDVKGNNVEATKQAASRGHKPVNDNDLCIIKGEDSTLTGRRGQLGILRSISQEGFFTIEFFDAKCEGVSPQIVEKMYGSKDKDYKTVLKFQEDLVSFRDVSKLDKTAALLVKWFSRLKEPPTTLDEKILKTLLRYYSQPPTE
jgi:hypothetical protein